MCLPRLCTRSQLFAESALKFFTTISEAFTGMVQQHSQRYTLRLVHVLSSWIPIYALQSPHALSSGASFSTISASSSKSFLCSHNCMTAIPSIIFVQLAIQKTVSRVTGSDESQQPLVPLAWVKRGFPSRPTIAVTKPVICSYPLWLRQLSSNVGRDGSESVWAIVQSCSIVAS